MRGNVRYGSIRVKNSISKITDRNLCSSSISTRSSVSSTNIFVSNPRRYNFNGSTIPKYSGIRDKNNDSSINILVSYTNRTSSTSCNSLVRDISRDIKRKESPVETTGTIAGTAETDT